MIQQFRGTESEDSILFKITNRRQGERETFDEFYNAILDLKDRLTNERMSDQRIIGILYHNAKFQIKAAMASANYSVLIDFVNKCRQIDELYYPNLYRDPHPSSRKVAEIDSTPVNDNDIPYNVEAFSHRRPHIPQSVENMKCWNCDQTGHSWQTCEEPRQFFCYTCGYKRVTCKTCPRCSVNFRSGANDNHPPISQTPSAPPLERDPRQ